MSIFDTISETGSKAAEAVKGAGESYWNSEMERWEETKELGPIGTFKRGLTFGATGPAPSIKPDGGIDFGPPAFDPLNRAGWRAAGGNPDQDEEGNPMLLLVAGLILLALLGQAFGPAIEAGAAVTDS
jgi:hypothetical protein